MVAKRPAAGAALLAQKRKAERLQQDQGEERAVKPKTSKPDNSVQHLLGLVAQAIQDAQVPGVISGMLVGMLEHSLGSFFDDRHTYQNSIVDMIGEVLAEEEKRLQKSVVEEQEHINETEGSRAKREAAVVEAEKIRGLAYDASHKTKHALSDVAKAFKEAKEAVAAAQASQKVFDKELQASSHNKDLLESTVTDYVKPLIEGTVQEADASHKLEHLLDVLKRFGFDESMLSALPAALSKDPKSRGVFDMTCVAQLDDSVATRMNALRQELATGEGNKAEHAKAIAAAEAAFEDSRLQQHHAASAFTSARAEHKAAEESLEAAKKDLDSLEEELSTLKQALINAESALAEFVNEVKAAFLTLKDRVSPPPVQPVAEVGDMEVGEPGEPGEPAEMVDSVAAEAAEAAGAAAAEE